MDNETFFGLITAVIIANAACFAFFMGAIQAGKSQKMGAKDSELPLWVYPCLIAAPSLVALGGYLL